MADEVGFGPGRLGCLQRSDRFLNEELRLRLGQRRDMRLRLLVLVLGFRGRGRGAGAQDCGRNGLERARLAGAGVRRPLAHQRREVERPGIFAAPGAVVGPLAQARERACVGRAPELRLECLRQARGERADAAPPRGEHVHERLVDSGDLPAVPIGARDPLDAEFPG